MFLPLATNTDCDLFSSDQLPTLNNEDIFEDANCDLFKRLNNTNSFKKFGRKGHDQKVPICL